MESNPISEGLSARGIEVTDDVEWQVDYLPASRYWALQGIETSILLVLAARAVGFCFWRIRRDF